MVAVANQLNIKGYAAVRLFEWWTPPSLVPLSFRGGEELPKICSMCVHLTQPELHTKFASPVYYCYRKSIEYQWRWCWPAVRTKNVLKLGTFELPGWRGAAKSFSPPRKFNGTKLGGVHCSIRQRAASPLIFNWFSIAAIALVYGSFHFSSTTLDKWPF